MKRLALCSMPAALLFGIIFSFQNCTGTQLDLPGESTEASSIEVPVPDPIIEEEPEELPPNLVLVSEEIVVLENANIDINTANQTAAIDFMHTEGTVKSIKLRFYDPDQLQEGVMSINGMNPIVLFEGTGLDAVQLGLLDAQQVDINFNLLPAQSESIVVGANTINFEYTATAGFSIYSILLTVEKLVPAP